MLRTEKTKTNRQRNRQKNDKRRGERNIDRKRNKVQNRKGIIVRFTIHQREGQVRSVRREYRRDRRGFRQFSLSAPCQTIRELRRQNEGQWLGVEVKVSTRSVRREEQDSRPKTTPRLAEVILFSVLSS